MMEYGWAMDGKQEPQTCLEIGMVKATKERTILQYGRFKSLREHVWTNLSKLDVKHHALHENSKEIIPKPSIANKKKQKQQK